MATSKNHEIKGQYVPLLVVNMYAILFNILIHSLCASHMPFVLGKEKRSRNVIGVFFPVVKISSHWLQDLHHRHINCPRSALLFRVT